MNCLATLRVDSEVHLAIIFVRFLAPQLTCELKTKRGEPNMKRTSRRLLLLLTVCLFAIAGLGNSRKQSLAQLHENVSAPTRITQSSRAVPKVLSLLKSPASPVLAGYRFQDQPCAPLGDPLVEEAKKYKGYNTFYLCKESATFNSPPWGPSVELFITCRASTRRSGAKWHIWCNSDGSHCGCNKDDFNSGERSCCQWSAGDHCTNDGASPGQNRCATW